MNERRGSWRHCEGCGWDGGDVRPVGKVWLCSDCEETLEESSQRDQDRHTERSRARSDFSEWRYEY